MFFGHISRDPTGLTANKKNWRCRDSNKINVCLRLRVPQAVLVTALSDLMHIAFFGLFQHARQQETLEDPLGPFFTRQCEPLEESNLHADLNRRPPGRIFTSLGAIGSPQPAEQGLERALKPFTSPAQIRASLPPMSQQWPGRKFHSHS